MRRVKATREHGMAAVLFAVVATVMFGMGAMVIDTGALYQERRELQTGADAGALALAQQCAKDAAACINLSAKADVYADANVADNNALATATLKTKVDGTKAITVVAETPVNNQVPFLFAPIIGGPSQGIASATATAAFGYPAQANALPLTFSICEWQSMVGTPPVFPSAEKLIFFHGTSENVACPFGNAGSDADPETNLPGGFGKLDTPDGDCLPPLIIGSFMHAITGSAPPTPPSGCTPDDIYDSVVSIPIYDTVHRQCPTGPRGRCYHIYGFAVFHITGFNLGGRWKRPSGFKCGTTGRDDCIQGYFMEFSATSGATGGPDLGLTVFYLTK